MTDTEKTPGPDTREEIDEVVRHTDSGSGASQAEHWPANVEPEEKGKPGAPAKPFETTGSI